MKSNNHNNPDRNHKPLCLRCAAPYSLARARAGYRICLLCGEEAARDERAHWTVIQQYGKGGYMYVTAEAARLVLRGTNQKQVRD